MAQIIQHKRGSLEKLSSVTGSLQKGEIAIVTGSAKLSGVTNGQGLVFAAVESGSVVASNRILQGGVAPIFSASIYNGLMKGVPFYASSSNTLYLLGSDGNDAIDLTGNISAFSTSVDSRLDSIETSLGGGGSLGTRVANLETISASYLDFTQSYYSDSSSFQSGIDAVAGDVTSLSSSVATSISASAATLNSTINTLSTSVDSRLDAIEFLDTTFATTGSNIFQGTQTITGSLYITQDLVVYGSSSLQNITASAASLGTNTIILNTADPAFRFGGISVIDSGSQQNTGSLLWDSEKEHWIYQRAETGSYGSAMLIAGPKNTGSLGNEIGLTVGYVPVAVGDDHIGDSIISASATKVTINGGLDVTGNISSSTISGIGNVSEYSTSVDSRVSTIEASIGGGGSLGTRVANLETISSSYLDFTQSYYSDSASFDTRISSSKAEYTSFSASAASELNSVSGAIVTALSASNANETALSGAIATTISNLSASLTTTDSASKAEYTSFSASLASELGSVSGAVATTISNLSSSLTTTDSASAAFAASQLNSVSGAFATSVSASNAEIAALSASVASTTGDFSSSVAGRLTTIETTYATTGSNTFSGKQNITGDVDVTGSIYVKSGYDLAVNHIIGNNGFIELGNVDTDLHIQANADLYLVGSGSGVHVHDSNFSVAPSGTDVLVVSASITKVTNEFSASNISGVGNISAFSQSVDSRLNSVETFKSDIQTAIELTGSSVTILGDLKVNGTTTQIDSTVVNIGDNIISLNGTGGTFGGLVVKDPTSPNTASGSLLWDTTNDYWIAGTQGTESKILLAVGDDVVSSSVQIDITSTTGFTGFDTAISTSFSASNAEIASLSSSVASVTGNFSSSVATSFSASNAALTALSTSVDSRLDTLEGNVGQAVNTTSDVTFASVTSSINIPSGGGNSKRLAFRGVTDTLEFVTAPTTAGDMVQWDGSDFVMSNVIDGGSF